MTEFRTTDQVQADFRRLDPQFTQITDLNALYRVLSDHPLDEASLYASGSGPVLYDLGVLNGSEWAGVRQFLDSQLVSAGARSELQQLQRDLQAADTNGDHVLNNQELVAFAQSHTDRWGNVAQFRSAAELFLNRLPGYLAQTNLNDQQVSRLWGVLNHLARENDRLGVAQDRRGTVYGLSLQGFPSEDTNNPPPLIQSVRRGELTPQQLAAIHHVLETQMAEGRYAFQAGAPLSPMDIGILGQILERAAAEGHSLHGMRVVSGEAETQLFADRNQAARRCTEGISRAMASSTGLQEAFAACTTDMERLEAQNPDRIGVRALLMRAYTGDLSAAETVLLRRWMQQEAQSLGMTCNGTLECMAQGASQLFQTIANNPGHFIARNGAFLGGAWLYRRFFLRNAFENRLSQACGGRVINPRDAYRQYERHLSEQMRGNPAWRRFLNQLARNPRRESLLGRVGINFPVTFLHLAAFNAVAAQKDTGNLAVDILTDMPLIAMFEAMDTFDAFNRTAIQNFAQANPGLCRGQGATEPVPATAPAPEQSAASERANARSMNQAQLEAVLNGGAPALTPEAIGRLPQELQGVFTSDLMWGAGVWEQQQVPLMNLIPQQGESRIGEMLVQRYAADNPSLAARIRQDVGEIATVFRRGAQRPDGTYDTSLSTPRTNGVRWALRQYIQNLESGGYLSAAAYVPLIQEGGAVEAYYGIRSTQASIQSTSDIEHRHGTSRLPSEVSFEYAARQHGEMIDRTAYNQAHPETWHSSSSSSSEGVYDGMPRNAQGQPIIFILPLPIGGFGALIEALFGTGAAATGTGEAIGWGAMALSGA